MRNRGRACVFMLQAAGITWACNILARRFHLYFPPIAVRMAAMMAGHGFVVAVPEIFHEFEPPGTALAYDPAGTEKGNRYKVEKPASAHDLDARAVIQHLQAHPACTGRLGAMGICIGGHLAFRAAMNPGVEAAACFYATDIHKRSLAKGMHDDTLDRMREIKGEMLMVWGRQDPHVPREGRRLIYDAMSGDHTLFSSAEGIESLWERSEPLLANPPPVRPYRPVRGGPTRSTS